MNNDNNRGEDFFSQNFRTRGYLFIITKQRDVLSTGFMERFHLLFSKILSKEYKVIQKKNLYNL